MKPIFCTDVTVSRSNQDINGREFITNTSPEGVRSILEGKAEELQKTIEKAKFPSWLMTVKSVCGFMSVLMGFSAFSKAMEGGIPALLEGKNAGVVILCAVCAAAWFYLNKMSKDAEKKLDENPEIKEKSKELEGGINMIFESMGVPASATDTDVIMFRYKIKNGVITPDCPPMLPAAYFNFACKAYSDGDNLCLADTENVFSFNKSEIVGIRRVEKKINMASWNKETPPTDPQFAEYGVSIAKMGFISVPYYYAIDIVHDGESFELYFPPYEIATFASIIGKKALSFLATEEDDEDELMNESDDAALMIAGEGEDATLLMDESDGSMMITDEAEAEENEEAAEESEAHEDAELCEEEGIEEAEDDAEHQDINDEDSEKETEENI